MKKIYLITISTLVLFIGCVDDSPVNTESLLIALLDADEVAGVDGFETDGDAELDHEFGLETDGVGRIMTDTLAFGKGIEFAMADILLIETERSNSILLAIQPLDWSLTQSLENYLAKHLTRLTTLKLILSVFQKNLHPLSFARYALCNMKTIQILMDTFGG